jgi:hypothetical protein
MLTKLKHNKKRNTAFLYEALIRELTKFSIKKDKDSSDKVISVIKEFYNNDSVLFRELKLYENILNTESANNRIAEKILFESKMQYSVLDHKKIFTEQSRLISKINKELNSDVFNNFVPNYKSLATLQQVFNNSDLQAKERVLLEESIIEIMSTEETGDVEDSKLKHVDSLAYKSFVKRFNESYGQLNESQRSLLVTYINSFQDNGLEMKIYLDEELSRLKSAIASIKDDAKLSARASILEQADQVGEILESFSNSDVDEAALVKIIKIQELVEELDKND